MDLAELERRLTRLEDIEAIKQLKARYCEICDDDHNPDRITSVFAEDGIWEGAEFGTANGHANIRKLFEWVRFIEKALPVREVRLWSEGEENFEARLEEILAAR